VGWECLYFILVFRIVDGVFNKIIFPLALAGYEMVTAKLALGTSLAIYHLISTKRKWSNC